MICEGHRDGNMEWANRASPERRAWIPAAILGADFLDLFHFVLGAICVLGEIRARTHTNTMCARKRTIRMRAHVYTCENMPLCFLRTGHMYACVANHFRAIVGMRSATCKHFLRGSGS